MLVFSIQCLNATNSWSRIAIGRTTPARSGKRSQSRVSQEERHHADTQTNQAILDTQLSTESSIRKQVQAVHGHISRGLKFVLAIVKGDSERWRTGSWIWFACCCESGRKAQGIWLEKRSLKFIWCLPRDQPSHTARRRKPKVSFLVSLLRRPPILLPLFPPHCSPIPLSLSLFFFLFRLSSQSPPPVLLPSNYNRRFPICIANYIIHCGPSTLNLSSTFSFPSFSCSLLPSSVPPFLPHHHQKCSSLGITQEPPTWRWNCFDSLCGRLTTSRYL